MKCCEFVADLKAARQSMFGSCQGSLQDVQDRELVSVAADSVPRIPPREVMQSGGAVGDALLGAGDLLLLEFVEPGSGDWDMECLGSSSQSAQGGQVHTDH